jgi:hypothetical protein
MGVKELVMALTEGHTGIWVIVLRTAHTAAPQVRSLDVRARTDTAGALGYGLGHRRWD